MSYTALLLTKARKELITSWNWYEDRQSGLGDRFVKEVFLRLSKIEQNPEQFPLRTKQYHEAIVPLFPYLIIYRINNKEKAVIVVSIFHTKRNPKKK